jgi:hypothetical protein
MTVSPYDGHDRNARKHCCQVTPNCKKSVKTKAIVKTQRSPETPAAAHVKEVQGRQQQLTSKKSTRLKKLVKQESNLIQGLSRVGLGLTWSQLPPCPWR